MNGYLQALDINPIIFGDVSQIGQNGLDNAGRYEKVFEALRNELAPYKKELDALFPPLVLIAIRNETC